MECRPNCSRNPILLLYGEIVFVSFLLLTALAISTKDADIAYGYILFHFDDISPSDPELIEALSSIWGVLCGKEKTLLDESRIDSISVQCSELLVVQHANRQYPNHNVSVSSNSPSNPTVCKICATRWTDRLGRSQNPFSRARKKKSSWEETSSSVSPPPTTTVPSFSSHFSIRPSSSPQHHHLTRPQGSSLSIPPQFRAWKQRSAILRRYLLRFLHLATLRNDVSRILLHSLLYAASSPSNRVLQRLEHHARILVHLRKSAFRLVLQANAADGSEYPRSRPGYHRSARDPVRRDARR